MPHKANFTRAEASVQLALVKKGDYIACLADAFVGCEQALCLGKKIAWKEKGNGGGGGGFSLSLSHSTKGLPAR